MTAKLTHYLLSACLDLVSEHAQVARMPKRKEPELDPKEQYQRFKEAAKEAGVTDDEAEFKRAFRRVAGAAPSKSSSQGARARQKAARKAE